MKEDDIRPSGLRKKCAELFEEDAREFLSYSDKFVEVECPACGTSNKGTAFIKNGYNFKKCENCQTYYISPRPTPDLLKIYYSTSRASKFWQDYMFPCSKDERIKDIYKPRVDLILDALEKYKIGRDLFIDIGAGSGFLGEEVAQRKIFKKIILIEPGPMKIKNNSVIEVINDSFENVVIDLNPDFVTNFELIEHLFSPLDFLKKVYALMKVGSCFFFTTPNMEGFELLTIFDKSINIAGPDHLNYFNINSITLLLQNLGFRNIEVSTPGKLDADIVRNHHLEGKIDISQQGFLSYILIDKPDVYLEPFQNFLKENRLSSHMLVLVRK